MELNLNKSLVKYEEDFSEQLILNPVENVPFSDILSPSTTILHGLYNTDTVRTQEQKFQSKIQFAGREQITNDIQDVYEAWKNILSAEGISMRLFSGLHAHAVLFMGISSIGQKVMILPEKAGGHVSGRSILERLGLVVKEMPYDSDNYCINKVKFYSEYQEFQPDFIFMDRSEGLVYEDFSWLSDPKITAYKIFDASQYLTNIIVKDYRNPFDMGFDMVLSTMHKNLPGPQRAFIATKKADCLWKKLLSAISTYVSNMHTYGIYSAGLILNHYDSLKILSERMIENAVLLEKKLVEYNIPAIPRKTDRNNPPTHHCWIKPKSQKEAFQLFKDMEKAGLMTNYRLLPYNIGYGIRLGFSGASMQGLTKDEIPYLASIIIDIYNNGYTTKAKENVIELLDTIKKHRLYDL